MRSESGFSTLKVSCPRGAYATPLAYPRNSLSLLHHGPDPGIIPLRCANPYRAHRREPMPSFAHPLLLWLLLSVPLLVWWELARKRLALRFSDATSLRDLP